jgi:hypothetical protein
VDQGMSEIVGNVLGLIVYPEFNIFAAGRI